MSLKKTNAWKQFSQYVRQLEKGICFTCHKKKPWKEMDAGHFRHRSLFTFFLEIGVHCQCTYCNRFLHGNLGIYAVELDKKYGQGTAEKLIKESNKYRGAYTKKELKRIAEVYREKLKSLQ